MSTYYNKLKKVQSVIELRDIPHKMDAKMEVRKTSRRNNEAFLRNTRETTLAN